MKFPHKIEAGERRDISHFGPKSMNNLLQLRLIRSSFVLSTILASSHCLSGCHYQHLRFKFTIPSSPACGKLPSEKIKENRVPVTATMSSTSKKNLTIEEAEAELQRVPDVVIDGPGKIFKYIIIKATIGSGEKLFIRGAIQHEYHADIFDEFTDFVKKSIHPKIKLSCLGGGRIDHEKDGKKILVYGYSQGFGRADHEKAAELIRAQYPGVKVDWTNDGY